MTDHSFLTALSPICHHRNDPGNKMQKLRDTLAAHEQENSPFSDCPMVHMARLQILDQLIPPMGDTSGAHIKTKYLLFVVDLDGHIDDFLDCLYRVQPSFVEAVWGQCIGYPDYKGSVFFRRYIARCMFNNPLGYAGFPNSVQDTLKAVSRKQMLGDWVSAHEGLSDAKLKNAWQKDREKFVHPDIPKPGSF
ncbi:hypothetical protein [Kordiimonas gwangyangensis]|uniref:hypothetical protein n=1 Tax=Kordiimonas gwangyangensis TaxID=288022 RepID=UPI00035DBF1D|nr:hypothetical protein [Kordiimonas gwangyangensis]